MRARFPRHPCLDLRCLHHCVLWPPLACADGTYSPLPQFEEDLAYFLLIRGPYAWLGYGWVSCDVRVDIWGASNLLSLNHEHRCPVQIDYDYRQAELQADYGTPLGTCAETAIGSGVFVRKYAKALVQMDCNTYTGTVTQTPQ